MEVNKYYTPEIEEFHVGFEYETKSHFSDNYNWNEWKCDYHIFNINHIDGKTKLSVPETIKVKYLDQEDIESLGWKPLISKSIGKNHYTGTFEKTTRGEMLLEHDWLNNKITIKTPNYIRDGSGNFDGYIVYIDRLTIKNKSELKKLMNQLNIKNE